MEICKVRTRSVEMVGEASARVRLAAQRMGEAARAAAPATEAEAANAELGVTGAAVGDAAAEETDSRERQLRALASPFARCVFYLSLFSFALSLGSFSLALTVGQTDGHTGDGGRTDRRADTRTQRTQRR